MKRKMSKKVALILVGMGLAFGVVTAAAAYTKIVNGVIYECDQFGSCHVIGTLYPKMPA